MSTFDNTDEHFLQFAQSLHTVIEKYGDMPEKTVLQRQKDQMETLVRLEREFRLAVSDHRWGMAVYEQFVHYICEDKRNILAARPFFRERQKVFTERISKSLKARNAKLLQKFRFNYQFVLFVMKAKKWPPNSNISKLFNRITALRTEIVEMNMPLAISRARIFWSRTQKSQLSYMDLIQISCEGLMSAVDKFVLPFSKVFRAVAIGRIVGNFIDCYSETLIHFYPSDKRRIYRANKLVGRHAGGIDFEALAEGVNEGANPPHHTTPSEIADLMAAASCVSTDSIPVSDPDNVNGSVERFPAPSSCQPDVQVEYTEAVSAVQEAMEYLTIFERKLLKMKGISL